MFIVGELTIEEYKKALQKTKKEDIISIALHHIKKCRTMEKRLKKLGKTVNILGEENSGSIKLKVSDIPEDYEKFGEFLTISEIKQ